MFHGVEQSNWLNKNLLFTQVNWIERPIIV